MRPVVVAVTGSVDGAAGEAERQRILGAGQEPARRFGSAWLVGLEPAELERRHQRLGWIAENVAGADRRERRGERLERGGATRVGVEDGVVDRTALVIDRR